MKQRNKKGEGGNEDPTTTRVENAQKNTIATSATSSRNSKFEEKDPAGSPRAGHALGLALVLCVVAYVFATRTPKDESPYDSLGLGGKKGDSGMFGGKKTTVEIQPFPEACMAPEKWGSPRVSSSGSRTGSSFFPKGGDSTASVLTKVYNDSMLWGTYRPGHYFGVKSRTQPSSLISGLLWHTGTDIQGARHECQERDGLEKYGWDEHDGETFGRQLIMDKKNSAEITTEFVKPNIENVHWSSRILVQRANKPRQSKQPLSLYFYTAIDCDGATSPDNCLSISDEDEEDEEEESDSVTSALRIVPTISGNKIYIQGQLAGIGKFTLTLESSSSNATYFGIADVLGADVKSALEKAYASNIHLNGMLEKARQSPDDSRYARIKNRSGDIPDNSPWLPNKSPSEPNLVAVHFGSADDSFEVYAVLYRGFVDIDMDTMNPSHIQAAIDFSSARFHKNFERLFQLQIGEKTAGNSFSASEITVAKGAISNMLGGMGYFSGRNLIKGESSVSDSSLESFATTLFTAVPSRSFFPRGFMWDEGFHQILVQKWDPLITFDVLLHWFSNMHANQECNGGGWIPREIILGESARRRVPNEYRVQDVTVANPPTFLLTISDLIDAYDKGKLCRATVEGKCVSAQELTVFLRSIYDRLDLWIKWFLSSQKAPNKDAVAFRWRGRKQDYSRLHPMTLASGLDDYPRASRPSDREYHVDIMSWMIKGCQLMSRISNFILEGKAGGTESEVNTQDLRSNKLFYDELAKKLLSSLEKVHWSEDYSVYTDVGIHSEDGSFVDGIVCACQNKKTGQTIQISIPISRLQARGQEKPDISKLCPETHSNFLYPFSDGNNGYMTQILYEEKTIKFQHVPRLGYVSLFPFLLELLSPDSPHLGKMMELLANKDIIWSPYGLRSLSKSDIFYQQENAKGDAPYWRGHIWININFLALKALYHYKTIEGPYKERANILYQDLRRNLLSNVLSNAVRTSFLWEQYDDRTGKGIRSHPFTGWTALVLNIMAEMY